MENSDFIPPLSCGSIPLWKRLQEITLKKIRSGVPNGGLMSNSGLSSSSHRGREPTTNKTHVVYTRRWVLTNWVSSRTLQPSTEPVVANFFVPSDFLDEGQVSGLGTVHPLLTLNFFSKWFLPLFKRRTLSYVMDGLQKRRRRH